MNLIVVLCGEKKQHRWPRSFRRLPTAQVVHSPVPSIVVRPLGGEKNSRTQISPNNHFFSPQPDRLSLTGCTYKQETRGSICAVGLNGTDPTRPPRLCHERGGPWEIHQSRAIKAWGCLSGSSIAWRPYASHRSVSQRDVPSPSTTSWKMRKAIITLGPVCERICVVDPIREPHTPGRP